MRLAMSVPSRITTDEFENQVFVLTKYEASHIRDILLALQSIGYTADGDWGNDLVKLIPADWKHGTVASKMLAVVKAVDNMERDAD
jgi:hypothetical protein